MKRLEAILCKQNEAMSMNGNVSFRARATFKELDSIYTGHPGACDICGDTESKLQLDHCHTTGKYRGLLCRACNLALGHFKDDVDLMRKAIDYIER